MAMEKQEVSRTELAMRLGKHRSKIDELARTRISCTLSTAQDIAKALGMPLSELLKLAEE
jgi:plasmid maintenance system antidote protein VapI